MVDLKFSMQEVTDEMKIRWQECIASINSKEAMIRNAGTSNYGMNKFNSEMLDIRRGMKAMME